MGEEAIAEHELRPSDDQDGAAEGSFTTEQQQLAGLMEDTEMHAKPDKDDTITAECTVVFTLQGHRRSVSSLSISPDGQQLASSGADGLLKIWSMATGAHIATLDAAMATQTEPGQDGDERQDGAQLRLGISDIAWSKDGRYLVSGGDDCLVRVWDAGKVRFFLDVFCFFFTAGSYSNDLHLFSSTC